MIAANGHKEVVGLALVRDCLATVHALCANGRSLCGLRVSPQVHWFLNGPLCGRCRRISRPRAPDQGPGYPPAGASRPRPRGATSLDHGATVGTTRGEPAARSAAARSQAVARSESGAAAARSQAVTRSESGAAAARSAAARSQAVARSESGAAAARSAAARSQAVTRSESGAAAARSRQLVLWPREAASGRGVGGVRARSAREGAQPPGPARGAPRAKRVGSGAVRRLSGGRDAS